MMKRLTTANGSYCDTCAAKPRDEFCSCDEEIARYEKLRAYEDTGLTPEEIHALSDDLFSNYNEVTPAICRGIELWKAEVEGRLIVLPCKVGDEVPT